MKNILVVEDEPILALDLCDQLAGAGFAVVGPAFDAAEGLELVARMDCDLAILDVNLGRETSEPVARELRRRGIPFVIVSGYSCEHHPPAFKGAPLVAKPIRIGTLIAEMKKLL